MKRKNQAAHPKLIIVLGLIPLIVLLYLYLSPKPVENQSVFGADTCSAPCWFGITPGESDYLDLEYLFQNRSDVFGYFEYHDNETNPTTDAMNGSYDFYWRNYEGFLRQNPNNVVVIKDNIVDMIAVNENEEISLGYILEVLGQPNDIQYYEGQVTYLSLIYTESLLKIGLISDLSDDDGCWLPTIEDDFRLRIAIYYSYDAAISPVIAYDGTTQPKLTAYVGDGSQRQISAELWQNWLSSGEDISCREAGRLLPETIMPIDFPSTP